MPALSGRTSTAASDRAPTRPVLVPMSESEYLVFLAGAVPDYAADKVASGEWTTAQSLDLAKQSFDSLVPEGLRTEGHHFFTIRDDDQAPVGVLWFAEKQRGGSDVAYVYNVGIEPAHRRRGHARRAFFALEDELRKLGLSGVALHVFGHNPAAQALYAKLGYRPTNINMFKAIRPDSA